MSGLMECECRVHAIPQTQLPLSRESWLTFPSERYSPRMGRDRKETPCQEGCLGTENKGSARLKISSTNLQIRVKLIQML